MSRKKEETLALLEMFLFYVSLGRQRSIQKVADKYGISRNTLLTYSRKYNWQTRSKIIDNRISKQVQSIQQKIQDIEDIEAKNILIELTQEADKEIANYCSQAKNTSIKDLKLNQKVDVAQYIEGAVIQDTVQSVVTSREKRKRRYNGIMDALQLRYLQTLPRQDVKFRELSEAVKIQSMLDDNVPLYQTSSKNNVNVSVLQQNNNSSNELTQGRLDRLDKMTVEQVMELDRLLAPIMGFQK